MIRRLVTVLAAIIAAVSAMTATVMARPNVQFATPTTSTASTAPPRPTPPVLASPTTTTTTTTTSTTTTTTTAPPLAAPPTTPMTLVLTTPAPSGPQLAAPTTSPPSEVDDLILGELDTSGALPDDLAVDLSALPGAPAGPGADVGPQLSAGNTCLNQCIKSGVMRPRGFGALLELETHVPARLFMTVTDADGDLVGSTDSTTVTEFAWAIDHLEPGATYDVLVAATDENQHTSYAYGEFVTLGERAVTVAVGTPVTYGGPTNIVDTNVYLKVADLDYNGPFDAPAEFVYYSLPRMLDLGVHVFHTWQTSWWTLCENHAVSPEPTYGNSNDQCGTWNTATVSGVDSDPVPASQQHWTTATASYPLTTGDGVPPEGQGARYFDFSVWVTITVTYS